MNFTSEDLQQLLKPYSTAPKIWVAYSGGLDSHVLLHALAQVRDQLPPLAAVYVDHGLVAESADWGRHCKNICATLGVEFHRIELALEKQQGQSLEAMAREKRYAGLESLIGEHEIMLTAQHQDDQAETLLLQLMRGSGPAGLASMPKEKAFGLGRLVRPLLGFSRQQLRGYAQAQRLSWVEDSSNQDDAYDRNYLRNRVIPVIQARWPAMGATISRSAAHCAEAVALLEKDLDLRLDVLCDSTTGTLPVDQLQSLSDSELKQVLRGWIRRRGFPDINSRKLEQVRSQMLEAADDRNPHIEWPGAELRRYRDKLYLLRPLQSLAEDLVIRWDGKSSLQLPADIGILEWHDSDSGVDPSSLLDAKLEIRFRSGGEKIRSVERGVSISLKQLFQERGVPPWLRDRVPLLYINGRLAVVGDWMVDAAFAANPGERGWKLLWAKPEGY